MICSTTGFDAPDSRMETQPMAEAPVRKKKERSTAALIGRARNASWWTPGMTLAGLVEEGLTRVQDEVEMERGTLSQNAKAG